MASAKAIKFNRDSGTFEVSSELLLALSSEFPSVNIRAELTRMEEWLRSPRGQGRRGTTAFVRRWLSNAPRKPSTLEHDTAPDPKIIPLLNQYLGKLWQNREHIHALNSVIR